MSFFNSAFKSMKGVMHSNIMKGVVGAIAVVYPPVGVPLAAGLAVANKLTDQAESTVAAVKAEAQSVIDQTKKLAATGDIGAKRGLALIEHVAAAKFAADPAVKALARAKLGKLVLNDKKRRLSGQILARQFGITRGGRIVRLKSNVQIRL